MTRTAFATCPLCEAMCGLKFEVDGQRVTAVAPDEHDVFSQGFICPKGAAITELHDDPDRLRTPVRRTSAGDFEPISWDEALALTADRLRGIKAQHGADATAIYIGNPVVHNHGVLALRNGLMRALGTHNSMSASSQDTAPRFAASYYLYGSSLSVPVPDIDRTHYFLCLGANPRVSNGSFMSAPNFRQRMKAIRDRGGRVVVVDPWRSETAREADEHLTILPGGDAAFLLALAHVLVAEGRTDRAGIEKMADGWPAIERALTAFSPERVERSVGIDAVTIRRIAHEFAAALTAVAYTRVGVCNAAHGTVASLATDVLNLVGGRLGRVGGSMFPTPALDLSPIMKSTKADGHGRWRSRVRGLPETLGDLPASILAEEIETPGAGQVRALVTFAGNPVLSTPNGRRLSAALAKLDFMVSVDMYVNETTRHADVILPPAGGMCDAHVDLIFTSTAVRNVVRWSPAVLPRPEGAWHDWQIILELIYRLGGGPLGMPALDWYYRWGRHVGIRWSPDATIGLLLRLGPYGDRFLPWSRGLNLKKLKAAPHGIDLGPLQEGIAQRVYHRGGRMQLAAAPLVRAVEALAATLDQPVADDALLLVGRRQLRSNNSWLHNLPSLVSGRERCVLLVHPQDAARAGINHGETALLENHVHRGQVTVHVTDEMRAGVVSLPHGWGHGEIARWQHTAGSHAGVSFNDWTDDQRVESVVGQSILNGVHVRLRALTPAADGTSAPAAAASVAAD
ncbi:MAG: molybdopterin-dependent oxidoreductase [Pirellulales bacterium]